VRYLAGHKVRLSARLSSSGSRVTLRLPRRNAWKAINETFQVSAELGRFVAALVAASSSDRTDRWTEWGQCSQGRTVAHHHKCQRPENPQHDSFKLLCCGFLGNATKRNYCVVDAPATQRKLW